MQGACRNSMLDDSLSSANCYGKGIYPVVKRKGDLEDFEVPVWQDIGALWYAKLNRPAREYGITRAEVLKQALAALEKARKLAVFRKLLLKSGQKGAPKLQGKQAKQLAKAL